MGVADIDADWCNICNCFSNSGWDICPECAEKIGYNKAIDDVVEEIDKDTTIQQKYLKNNFEADRPIKWRIIGNKLLKKKIRGLK